MEQGIKVRLKRTMISSGLEAAALLKGAGLMRDVAGLGTIFTLHHVRPALPCRFAPNAHLEVSPDFLDRAIARLKQDGYKFIALDALPSRAKEAGKPPFVAVTLDDGNRDNLEHALPIFARHDVPFTIFVTQGLSERSHTLWWETLGELLGRLDRLTFDFGSGEEFLPLGKDSKKHAAFARFAAFVHSHEESEAVGRIDELARRHGLEPLDIVRASIMDRDELRQLARHPLASLGAHTVSHRALARLPEAEAVAEMALSADYVADITGKRPTTIAYPYGTNEAVSAREGRLAAELGFSVGVTTRPGTITTANGNSPLLLPRLSLNGHYQKPRYASALASGIPMRLMGRRETA
ncbi:peptidoglycan/xylan/chitin deacetylase (PgdA/CDA1 family) [Rhizobium sp. ERR 922]|uniref:polysaccharide deacetylase family protein n=1 Tax=unclassified Rhizobium TaxID=2613769 RepID=UPI0011A2FC65|nr:MULTISPECIES: polysaccharide deacetylase family protein [unclassified Rhizobium]TWB55479.1 peptidoglycan/xylan/chitin deacetylase (PgdA/CDA1 family) [Rhizobium sp. ERR 922]TWB97187.1 peptidoglycan/xylan/chitin deacetylase (PgdA/CDA1 family) [Rhizobium sp. ERR 942]